MSTHSNDGLNEIMKQTVSAVLLQLIVYRLAVGRHDLLITYEAMLTAAYHCLGICMCVCVCVWGMPTVTSNGQLRCWSGSDRSSFI